MGAQVMGSVQPFGVTLANARVPLLFLAMGSGSGIPAFARMTEYAS